MRLFVMQSLHIECISADKLTNERCGRDFEFHVGCLVDEVQYLDDGANLVVAIVAWLNLGEKVCSM